MMSSFSDTNIIQNILTPATYLYFGSNPEPVGYSLKFPMSLLQDSAGAFWPQSEINVQTFDGSNYRTLTTTEWQIYNNYLYIVPSTMTLPTVTGWTLTIYRVPTTGQQYDGAAWNVQTPAGIAASLDSIARTLQRAMEWLGRTLSVHAQDTGAYDAFNGANLQPKMVVPRDATARALKVLGFDATGNKLSLLSSITGVAGDVNPTAGTAIVRDGSARGKVADPSAPGDIDTLGARNTAVASSVASEAIARNAAIALISPGVFRMTLQGLALTWASNTSFSIGPGAIGDSTFVDIMVNLSTITKTTLVWSLGNGGGLDTGSIGASSWYAVYEIKRPDTGVVDFVYSLNTTSPLLPTNYTLFRRIGWVRTNGSSQFIQWQQVGRQFNWMAKIVDLNAVTPASTNRILTTVTTPKGSIGLFVIIGACTSAFNVDAGWTALTDAAASGTNEVMLVPSGSGSAVSIEVPVDSSNQIYYRVSATSGNTISLLTQGWIDNL